MGGSTRVGLVWGQVDFCVRLEAVNVPLGVFHVNLLVYIFYGPVNCVIAVVGCFVMPACFGPIFYGAIPQNEFSWGVFPLGFKGKMASRGLNFVGFNFVLRWAMFCPFWVYNVCVLFV